MEVRSEKLSNKVAGRKEEDSGSGRVRIKQDAVCLKRRPTGKGGGGGGHSANAELTCLRAER